MIRHAATAIALVVVVGCAGALRTPSSEAPGDIRAAAAPMPACCADDSALDVPGTYLATHRDWRLGFLSLHQNGDFLDERGDHVGSWRLDGGELVLSWFRWGENRLRSHDRGLIWSCPDFRFVLVKE